MNPGSLPRPLRPSRAGCYRARPTAGLVTLLLLLAPCHRAAAQIGDVVFVATPMEVAIGMLNLAGVTDSDVVYDLGSGDGRIVIAAAKHYGARAVGIDIDPNLVEESRRSADTAGVSRRVEFRQGDLFETDLREASVVTLYLGRMLNERLRPTLLRELRPGSRVVSQNFDMGDWEPDSVVIVRGRHFGETPVHLWIIPADVRGTWTVVVEDETNPVRFPLTLSQQYQTITGNLRARGRLRGDRITFTLERAGAEPRFEGVVRDNDAGGTVTRADGRRLRWKATRPPRPEARRP